MFLILKSDNIENSRTELKGIVFSAPSNQTKITFFIILPFNLAHLWFFLFHIEIEGKWGWIIGGGGKGYVAPPLSNYWGGLPPPPPPPLFLRLCSFIKHVDCSLGFIRKLAVVANAKYVWCPNEHVVSFLPVYILLLFIVKYQWGHYWKKVVLSYKPTNNFKRCVIDKKFVSFKDRNEK